MSRTMDYTGTLLIIECAECHMDFGVQRRFDSDRRRDHKTFWCPSGHNNYYPQKSDIEELRDQVDRQARARTQLLSQLDQAEADSARAKRRVVAMKGVVTKTKKRIAAGRCVRCSVEFPDLAEHMADAHPDYDPEK